MTKCSVRGCQSSYTLGKVENLSFFSLPKDAELRKKWLQSIPTSLPSVKCPLICENHFLVEDIIRSSKAEGEECCRRPLLKRNTVPSVFSVVPPDPPTEENDGWKRKYLVTAPCIDLSLSALNPQQFSSVEGCNLIGDPQQCTSAEDQEKITLPQSNSQKRRFQCEHCHETFPFQRHLKTHLRVHTGERPYPCNKPDKVFTYRYQRAGLPTSLIFF